MKRAFDVVVSTCLLVLLIPVFAIVCLIVLIGMGRPILFRQIRPGLHGQPFCMTKFRTMSNAVDSNGIPLPDDQRLGRIGRFLRSTSLDELPELLNVVKGEMSLVGPRPLLMQYLPLYTQSQARRHEVRPGITGLAQVNGRNALSWDEKFALDVWYVDHHDLWLDLKILALTAWKVIGRRDISAPDEATMPVFTGRDS